MKKDTRAHYSGLRMSAKKMNQYKNELPSTFTFDEFKKIEEGKNVIGKLTDNAIRARLNKLLRYGIIESKPDPKDKRRAIYYKP